MIQCNRCNLQYIGETNRDSIRKAKEDFLISKGRTLVPHGLNIREETY